MVSSVYVFNGRERSSRKIKIKSSIFIPNLE